jgi:putative flippase GtrA
VNFLSSPRERTRFIRFSVVGAIGAVVDFSTFNLFSGPLGVHPTVAQAFSFSAAVLSNFLLNRLWTYPDSRSKRVANQLGQFFIVNVIGLAIRTPIFAWASGLFGDFLSYYRAALRMDYAVLAHNLALAMAIGIVLFWNFFVNRYWTYSDVE